MRILAIAIALTLSGCSLVPVLDKPAAPVPDRFPDKGDATDNISPASHAADLGWRTMFGDPRLQRLITLALDNNRDLRLATLQVQAIQSQFQIQRAARLPGVDINASMTRERSTTQGTTSTFQEDKRVSLGTTAFEIDLFGRVSALSEAAFARYMASEQGRRAAQMSLVSAVADAYMAERLAAEQLLLAQSTLADWQQSLKLAHLLRQADQNSSLDIAQAEGQVATAEADLEARQRALSRARNALMLLVGTSLPDDLPEPLPLDAQPIRTRLPAGTPSDLLVRRPDILQAEQALIAANADIGAARAAFFPRISLTSSIGYASTAFGNLFDAGQRIWQFTPQITQPLFQGGRLRAELRLSEIRKSSAITEYERVIQVAFREVADGLAGSMTYGKQIDAQLRVVSSAERRLALSNLRYRSGLDGRLELLDAQRQLYAARQSLLDLRREDINNAIALYKALGGGLTEDNMHQGTL